MAETDSLKEVRDAYAQLHEAIDKAIEATHRYNNESNPGYILVDWAVAFGVIRLNSDGERKNKPGLLVRGGDQSTWTTKGILDSAFAIAEDQEAEEALEDDDDGDS